MSCDDRHPPTKPLFDLSINGLPWPLKPVDAEADPGCDCCEQNLLDVRIAYEELSPAEAVRADLSCDYSPLKVDDLPGQLDWNRVDGLPLDRR